MSVLFIILPQFTIQIILFKLALSNIFDSYQNIWKVKIEIWIISSKVMVWWDKDRIVKSSRCTLNKINFSLPFLQYAKIPPILTLVSDPSYYEFKLLLQICISIFFILLIFKLGRTLLYAESISAWANQGSVMCLCLFWTKRK